MLKTITSKIKSFSANLTKINNHPISKATLIIVLFLDLFILVSIFDGLSDHTRQLTSPSEYIPQYCRDIVIDEDWNDENRLMRTANIVSRYRGSYVYTHNKLSKIHPICTPLYESLQAIKQDQTLAKDLSALIRLRSQVTRVKSELDKVRGAYDTSLLEQIAKQNAHAKNTAALKKQVSSLTIKLNTLSNTEAESSLLLHQNTLMMQFYGLIENSANKNREELLAALRHLNFWFPVKRLGMEMIFLLPLILIFYLWNSKSISANRTYQSLVSSHLLVVVFIPVIFKILELIYELIPKTFLKHVFELLESLNLVAVWHYLMMGISIASALALIYVMQQKIFSAEKLNQKRIAKGDCQNCGEHLAAEHNACPACGFTQFKPCVHCNKNTYVLGRFCRECGGSLVETD